MMQWLHYYLYYYQELDENFGFACNKLKIRNKVLSIKENVETYVLLSVVGVNVSLSLLPTCVGAPEPFKLID